MYLLYDSKIRTKDNYKDIEGAGAIYQRIISLLALSKRVNIPFIHQKVNIGHNNLKMDDDYYDNKWDSLFNLESTDISQLKEQGYKEIRIEILTPHILEQLILNRDQNFLVYIKNPYLVTYNSPHYYYSNIQYELISNYNKSLIIPNIPLIYNDSKFKNKLNIAIHIRVYADMDDRGDDNNYENGLTPRFYLDSSFYIRLINKLKDLYKNSEIHIFSQNKYFDIRYKDLRKLEYLNFHLNMDNFATFHHLCKADVLVLGTSSFSHVAGLYNKNTVYYTYYEYHSKALDSWIDVNEFLIK